MLNNTCWLTRGIFVTCFNHHITSLAWKCYSSCIITIKTILPINVHYWWVKQWVREYKIYFCFKQKVRNLFCCSFLWFIIKQTFFHQIIFSEDSFPVGNNLFFIFLFLHNVLHNVLYNKLKVFGGCFFISEHYFVCLART